MLRPFKDRIYHVVKFLDDNDSSKEFIYVEIEDDDMPFPYFEKGTMYKGMKTDKNYTLEELGLFQND